MSRSSFGTAINFEITKCQTADPRGLERGATAARLLGLHPAGGREVCLL